MSAPSADTGDAIATPTRVSAAHVFGALLLRDLRVARRELPFFLLRTVMQPTLFVVLFGYLIPKMGYIGRGYAAVMVPGMLAVSLALAAIQAVAMPLATDFGFTKEIEDRLLAPAPIWVVAIEKTVSGALQGVISALVVLPLSLLIIGGLPELSFSRLGALLLVTALGALVFSGLGLWVGTAIPPQQIGAMFLLFAPMIFFGCAYFPWAGLTHSPIVKWAVLINPLTFVSEGLRGSMTPSVPHMPLRIAGSVLLALTVWLTWMGLRSFEKRAIT